MSSSRSPTACSPASTRPIKVFVGRRVGGRLRFQKKECLDVRWRNPGRIRPEDLAFGGDRKALRLWADIKIGKAKPERDYTSERGSSRSGDANQRKRQRATALVIKDRRYLLVRDKGHDKYSLPGGGMEQGEAALTAACRELGEELGMKAYRAERLFDYTNEGSFNDHKVVLVFAGGEPRINDRELESFRWWDGRERLSVYPHCHQHNCALRSAATASRIADDGTPPDTAPVGERVRPRDTARVGNHRCHATYGTLRCGSGGSGNRRRLGGSSISRGRGMPPNG